MNRRTIGRLAGAVVSVAAAAGLVGAVAGDREPLGSTPDFDSRPADRAERGRPEPPAPPSIPATRSAPRKARLRSPAAPSPPPPTPERTFRQALTAFEEAVDPALRAARLAPIADDASAEARDLLLFLLYCEEEPIEVRSGAAEQLARVDPGLAFAVGGDPDLPEEIVESLQLESEAPSMTLERNHR